jgi:Fe-S cluster assembly protein SufD
MTDLQTKPDCFVRQYEEIKPLLMVSGHSFFEELRVRGFREYTEFGIPTHRDEEFKYTSLRALTEEDYKFGYGANVERHQVDELRLGKLDAIRLVFVNGQFAPEASSFDSLPDGVMVCTFEDADPEVLQQHLGTIATLKGKLGSTNDERFVALNTAYLCEGAFVHIAKSITLSRPIHVVHVTSYESGNVFAAPRLLVVLEENAEAKLVEEYATLAGKGFSCPVAEVRLAKSARFEHIKYQNESIESIHVANLYVHQEAKSVYTSNIVNFGGAVARNDINVWVGGEYAETWLNGANVGSGNQVIDNHTRIDHAVPNCQSFEVYKSILKDHSVGVFNGKIFVYEDAQKTDAKQTNQAILLSPTATMNTKPQLEIFADDVKCTHGATIGQLREDALFYLRARGVEKSKAQALLVYAFAAEVLEKIGVESVKLSLEEALFEKLG